MAMASAISLPKANTTPDELAPRKALCALHAHFDKSWPENALTRYSVKATAEVEMEDIASSALSNLQCWYQDDHTYLAHVSTFIGDYGHQAYVNFHQTGVNTWRSHTMVECDVDSKW
ncbi:hypothetical protein B0T14DRAFT_565366 [Immersiella caudata]|uniref:Uncharacterized protein n=1 Tax=Immersiella caudata TaxID=314043 RepID=A0AA39WYM8_9PEZI|nr:hypothetical protein B0T14DRAFT_565366 [Immersiella caudata]